MKKLLFLFVLTCSNIILSQKFHIDLNLQMWTRYDDGRCNSSVKVSVYYKNSKFGKEQIYYKEAADINDVITNKELKGRVNKIEISFYAKEKGYDLFKNCCICKKVSVLDVTEERFVFNDCETGSLPSIYRNIEKGELKGNLTCSYNIRPIVKLVQPSSNIIGLDNLVEVKTDRESDSDKFSKSVYNWEYAVYEGASRIKNWTAIHQAPRGSDLKVAVNKILTKKYIGKTIHFRVSSCNGSAKSNSVFYKLTKSAPKILTVDKTYPTCYDSKDGTITVNFKDPIDSSLDEYLKVSLSKEETCKPNKQGVDICEIIRNSKLKKGAKSITFKGIPTGNYRIRLIGEINYKNDKGEVKRLPTFTGGRVDHLRKESLIREPVQFKFLSFTKKLNCHGDRNGEIKLEAWGGVSTKAYEYLLINKKDSIPNKKWIKFRSVGTGMNSKVTHTVKGLPVGVYEIMLKDANDCKVRIKDGIEPASGKIILGEIKKIKLEIEEPDKLVINHTDTDKKQPSGYGFSNGQLIFTISGGTPDNNKYAFDLKHEDGEEYKIGKFVTATWSDNKYVIVLNKAKAGKYTLVIKDKNYKDKNYEGKGKGCSETLACVLRQPEKLVLKLKEEKPISCNNANKYKNPSGDGILTTTVTGGVKHEINAKHPYSYTYIWYKKVGGKYVEIDEENSPKLENIGTGDYAVNVIDENKITIGKHVFDAITKTDSITPVPVDWFLKQPDLLTVSATKVELTCEENSKGKIILDIKGGIPDAKGDYDIRWAGFDDVKSRELDNLTANSYLVFITDSRGCEVKMNIELLAPNGLVAEDKVTNPSCYNIKNGVITLDVKGGDKPYLYTWYKGSVQTKDKIIGSTKNLLNIGGGEYSCLIVDAKGCKFVKKFKLVEPDEIIVNLGPDSVICKDQKHSLDASIEDPNATYSWTCTNGFTSSSPKIDVSEGGKYTVKVVSSKSCVIEDSVTIIKKDVAIDANFLMSSQAYKNKNVVLFNVSDPKPSVFEWVLPEGVTVINSSEDDSVTLNFENAKKYKIGFISKEGDCKASIYKTIVIEKPTRLSSPNKSENPFVKEFIVFPNPNEGKFKAKVKLSAESHAYIRIFNIEGELIDAKKSIEANFEHLFNFELSKLGSGVYFAVLETAKQTQIKGIIIK